MKEVTASARTAPLVYVELPGTQHISMLTGGGSDRIGLSAAPSDPGCKTPALLPKPTQRSQASLLVADFLSQTLAGRRDVRLDSLLRDPPPTPRAVDDPGPFFHGTRADLQPGDLLTPGWLTNYGSGKVSRHLYVTASENGAPLAAELARGDGRPRVYRVEPTGPIEDDPNVTDKRFPGNPTRSYRTTEPLRVVEEVLGWDPPQADLVARIRANTGQLSSLGIEAMD